MSNELKEVKRNLKEFRLLAEIKTPEIFIPRNSFVKAMSFFGLGLVYHEETSSIIEVSIDALSPMPEAA